MKKGALYILFAREPVAGKVKSRLAHRIGAETAARLYEALLKDAISCMRETKEPFALAYTPESNAGYFSAIAPEAMELLPQKGADLGARMKAVFTSFFEKGYEKVIIVGSDIPLITAGLLIRAGEALEKYQAVLGPCRDGGYYLIGLNRLLPELFSGIEWGSESVLKETLRIADSRGWSMHLLPPLFDVDLVEDLRRLSVMLEQRKKRGLPLPLYIVREMEKLGRCGAFD